MALTQWNPFREMEDLFSQLGHNFPRVAGSLEKGETMWAPAVDIAENAKEYRVTAELPGVRKEDVKVEAVNGVLTLTGDRKYVKEDKDEKSHRVERFYGSFTRSFTVPEDVLTDKIAAEFKDGILVVRLPKTDIKSKATAIRVQ